MKTNYFTKSALFAGLFALAACSNEEIAMEAPVESAPTEEITATAIMPQGIDSRLTMEEDGSVLSIKWGKESGKESFSVMKDANGSPVAFEEKTINADAHTATFTNKSKITVDKNATYYAFYPSATSATEVNLDMTGQTGEKMDSKVYMYASSQLSNKTLNFNFTHLTSILKVTLGGFPYEADVDGLEVNGISGDKGEQALSRADGTEEPAEETATPYLTSVTFTATSGLLTSAKVDITTNPVDDSGNVTYITDSKTEGPQSFGETKFTLTNGEATVYLHVLPGTITGLTVTAEDNNGKKYSAKIGDKELVAKKMYTADVTMGEVYVPALGDVMLDDGTLVHVPEGGLTDAQKAAAIGVVVHLYEDQTRVSDAVKTKLGGDAKGLVMALKNAKESCEYQWWAANGKTNITMDKLYKNYGDAYGSYNGYAITNKVYESADYKTNSSDFPVFKSVQEYTPTEITGTTGWYLPSLGEWADVIETSGTNIDALKTSTSENGVGGGSTLVNYLNGKLDAVGGDYVTTLSAGYSGATYWSSTEGPTNIDYAYVIDLQGDGSVDFSYKSKFYVYGGYVRCFLAF